MPGRFPGSPKRADVTVTTTDPIADMLTRIRNANAALHETVRMPSSKLKERLAAILEREGYIGGYDVRPAERGPGRILEIRLKYAPDRTRTIGGLRRVSKPGRRVYARADEVPRVLGGLGVAVLSTSQGLMTDAEARRRRIGGEVLCYVW
jgi:small subunit ribosomal protein S8